MTLPSSDSDVGISGHAEKVLAEAERQAEWVLALLRVAAFATIVVGLRVFEYASQDHVLLVSLLAYGSATVAAVVLAWRRFYHPITAWVLAGLDVALVVHFMLVDALHHAPDPLEIVAHPAPAMMFLLLAYSAVRYRPAVLVFSLVLFLGGVLAIWLIPALTGAGAPAVFSAESAAWMTILSLTAIALGIAARRARELLLRSLRETRLREMLARYVAAPVIDELDRPCAQAREVAVLFVDIRGFTAMSERRSGDEIVAFLETYRSMAERVVSRYRGIVDKFIGDAVLAIFDRPDPTENAAACLGCAVELLDEIRAWSEARRRLGDSPVAIGMGAHLGTALVGTIGRDGRLEYTVIGDVVNTTNRIERLSARYGMPLLASERLVRAAGPEWQDRFAPIGERHLRGRRERVPLLELKAEALEAGARRFTRSAAVAIALSMVVARPAFADDADLARALTQLNCAPAKITLLSKGRGVDEYQAICRGTPQWRARVVCAGRHCTAARERDPAPATESESQVPEKAPH